MLEVRQLDCSRCGLQSIPDIINLQNLDKLSVIGNVIEDISTLEHSNLKHLDVNLNPIDVLRVHADQCPNLDFLAAGSREMKAVSVGILKQIQNDKITLHIGEAYREGIIFPAPFVVSSNFNTYKLTSYLEECEFNVLRYCEKLEHLSDTTKFLVEAHFSRQTQNKII